MDIEAIKLTTPLQFKSQKRLRKQKNRMIIHHHDITVVLCPYCSYLDEIDSSDKDQVKQMKAEMREHIKNCVGKNETL